MSINILSLTNLYLFDICKAIKIAFHIICNITYNKCIGLYNTRITRLTGTINIIYGRCTYNKLI